MLHVRVISIGFIFLIPFRLISPVSQPLIDTPTSIPTLTPLIDLRHEHLTQLPPLLILPHLDLGLVLELPALDVYLHAVY